MSKPNVYVVSLVAIWAAVCAYFAFFRQAESTPTAADDVDKPRRAAKETPATPVTFNKEIAPLVWRNCAGCHRPGESAPFSLLTYDDVSKRARHIADVTHRRLMPPWLPEPGLTPFVGERRLSFEQIALIRRWVDSGAREGDAADLPALPKWPAGWELGQPDLVLELPPTYELPADGKDVYRNFVLPTGLNESKYVKGVELRLFGSKAVHHVSMLLDRSGTARRLDGEDDTPGYSGMNAGEQVASPDGQFVNWQPGFRALLLPEGMSWRLERASDVVLQIHMQPTGKLEPIKAALGFYFTNEAPRRQPLKLMLRNLAIDIPAGSSNYVVKEQFRTPVDLEVLALLPHTHYLGKDLKGYAVLPDGSEHPLIHIPDWDFNWQGDYQFKRPVAIPAGSRLVMEYRFDNSAQNPRNPHSPPQRVKFGLNSTDEMAELWLQVQARTARDRERLLAEYTNNYAVPNMTARFQKLVESEPNKVEHHVNLGAALIAAGNLPQALRQLAKAIDLDPEHAQAHYYRGFIAAQQNDAQEATANYELAIKHDANHYRALNDLGYVKFVEGDLERAEELLTRASQLNPSDALPLINLGRVRLKRDDVAGARTAFEAAVEADPENATAHEMLIKVKRLR